MKMAKLPGIYMELVSGTKSSLSAVCGAGEGEISRWNYDAVLQDGLEGCKNFDRIYSRFRVFEFPPRLQDCGRSEIGQL